MPEPYQIPWGEFNDTRQLMYPIHVRWEVDINAVKQATRTGGKPVTCPVNARCSACCYEPVYASIVEIEAALSVFKGTYTGDVVEKLIERSEEWMAKFMASGFAYKTEINRWNDLKQYIEIRLRCPFLSIKLNGVDQDPITGGKCTVYEYRPMSCMLHMACGPKEDCYTVEKRKTQQFVTSPQATVKMGTELALQFNSGVIDHLGVVMYNLLHGTKIATPCMRVWDTDMQKREDLFLSKNQQLELPKAEPERKE